MYEPVLLDLLQRSIADLAATSRNLKATSASCDDISGQVRAREASHIEFSLFTPSDGRPE